MRKTTVKGVIYLVVILVVILVGIMVLKELFPQLLETFDNPAGPIGSCEPYKTPCPEGQFCQNKQCYNRSIGSLP